MEHQVDVGSDQAAHDVRIGDVGGDGLDPRVPEVGRRRLIDQYDPANRPLVDLAELEQAMRELLAEEPGSAGDDDLHTRSFIKLTPER